MKQEAFVILVGVLLAAAAGIAIGGLPFGGGGSGSDVFVSATIAAGDYAGSTTLPVEPEKAMSDDSVPERAVPGTSPASTGSPGDTSASTATTATATTTTATTATTITATTTVTTTDVASAGPIPTVGTAAPNDADDVDDALRNRDSLLVAAANASGLDGVSVSKADELEAAGYVDVAAVDAVQPSSTSAIYFAPGLDREVFLVTADLAWDGVELLAMALAPDIEPPGEFDLLVLVGSDRAAPASPP